VPAVLYATVLDFRKHPLWIMLLPSVMLALGAPARDQGSQAQHGVPAQCKTSYSLGDVFVWRLLSANLQAGWTLGSAQVEEAFSAPPRSPGKHPQCKSWYHQCLWLLRWSIVLGGSSSSSVAPDPKPKDTVITLLTYTSNSKYPHKSHCLRCTLKTPSPGPDRPWARGPCHPHHSFLLIFTEMLWPAIRF